MPRGKSGSYVQHYDEHGREVFPCWCGKTHTGDYALYEFGWHNCPHDQPLVTMGLGQAMCRSCGRMFDVQTAEEHERAASL